MRFSALLPVQAPIVAMAYGLVLGAIAPFRLTFKWKGGPGRGRWPKRKT